MATHSSTLAWKLPWTEEPDGVAQSRMQLKRLSSSISRIHHGGTPAKGRDRSCGGLCRKPPEWALWVGTQRGKGLLVATGNLEPCPVTSLSLS